MKNIIIIILCLAIGAYGGYTYRGKDYLKITTDTQETTEGPVAFKDEMVITRSEVRSKLKAIGQLATYSLEYTIEKSSEDSTTVDFFSLVKNWKIPWSTNKITFKCSGIVKVGIEVSEIDIDVDNENKVITVDLPDIELLDNYVIWDSVEVSEQNNVINPISFDQYDILVTEIEKEGLKEAEDKKIYDKAETNLKDIIEELLEVFDGYEIKFGEIESTAQQGNN